MILKNSLFSEWYFFILSHLLAACIPCPTKSLNEFGNGNGECSKISKKIVYELERKFYPVKLICK